MGNWIKPHTKMEGRQRRVGGREEKEEKLGGGGGEEEEEKGEGGGGRNGASEQAGTSKGNPRRWHMTASMVELNERSHTQKCHQ